MALPVVIVATTEIAMAKALGQQLKQPCLKLGLKLKICPGALESQVTGGAQVGAYQSSEELFDYLESCDPLALADSLIVLDVGHALESAFEPCPPSNQKSGWYCSKVSSAGIGVEVLLRFPQLFPVFLSPLVKTDEPLRSTDNDPSTYILPMVHHEENKWKSFSSLVKKLQMVNRGENVNEVQATERDIKQEENKTSDETSLEELGLRAFETPLHFVSPVACGAGIISTLERFSRGMRCWFDPTGLRTLVKNRYLGMVFGGQSDWRNTEPQRKLLRGRLKKSAVAIDEERKFAVFNAYAAWKYGRRTWMVTTFDEFDKSPLWARQEGKNKPDNVLVLRDIDLRFPDVPPENKDFRNLAKDINSPVWEMRRYVDEGSVEEESVSKIGENWAVRAVSGEANVEPISNKCWQGICDEQKKEKRLGQRGKIGNFQYLGFQKPISSLHNLRKVMGTDDDLSSNPNSTRTETRSVVSKITLPEKGDAGHGAPYTNLLIAESLLRQSTKAEGSSEAHLLGALLASEAYELLLCMSKTTALEAFLLMHKAEVTAEVSFSGVSQLVNIKGRKTDVDAAINNIFDKQCNSKQTSQNEKNAIDASNMFLSQFWAELRPIYRDDEQFEAAEAANVESFVNTKWAISPKWPKWLSRLLLLECGNLGKLERNFKYILKSIILKTSTSIKSWLLFAFTFSLLITVPYYLSTANMGFLETWLHVLLSSLALSLNTELYNIMTDNDLHFLSFIHMSSSYILFGLFISMLYRKLTRS